MPASDYATSSDLKSALSLTGQTYADAEIAVALTAASRGIEGVCNRRFWADPDASQVRYYSPNSGWILMIDDLITLTALDVDPNGTGTFSESWTVNTDFVLEPLNAAAEDPARPYTRIEVNTLGARRFWPWKRSARVTGKFGWALVPTGIKEATIMLASILLRRVREAPFGVISLDEVSAVRIARTDPQVQFLIGPFMRLTV